MGYFLRMEHLKAFLEAEGLLEESPDRVVRLAASALLEISLLTGVKPIKIKNGVPVFKHNIPDERLDRVTLVKPRTNPVRAEAPASLTVSDTLYSRVTFSFEPVRDVVAMDFRNPTFFGGDSSVNAPGCNAIRNVWRVMHLPTISYVQQAATEFASVK